MIIDFVARIIEIEWIMKIGVEELIPRGGTRFWDILVLDITDRASRPVICSSFGGTPKLLRFWDTLALDLIDRASRPDIRRERCFILKG